MDEDKIKRLDFIYQRLQQRNEAKAYINSINKAVVEYYQVSAKEIKLII